MHRAASSSATILKASRLVRGSAPGHVLKRQVNVNHSLKPHRRITQSRAHQQSSTLAAPSFASKEAGEKLSWEQIKSVLLTAAIPMVGFGFMDNFVMIQAGSYIDNTLGVKFGLATMTAAAMGQVVSDVSGVLFGGSLERVLNPLVKTVKLAPAQLRLPVVSRLRLAGAAGGVIVGCLLGASSLYFVLDDDVDSAAAAESKMRQIQGVVQDMLSDVEGVRSCTVYTKTACPSLSASQNVSVAPWNDSAEHCVDHGDAIAHDNKICIPVWAKEEIVAVMELEGNFSHEAEQEARKLARNVGIFMTRFSSRSS